MKKKYIQPELVKGLTIESKHLIMSSLKGDDLQMEIHSSSVEGAADSRQGSFWDDSE